jgi:hypothetical protein
MQHRVYCAALVCACTARARMHTWRVLFIHQRATMPFANASSRRGTNRVPRTFTLLHARM